MDKISVRGAIDLHTHPYPCLFPRVGDDREIVLAARDAGMRAIVIKNHFESTASRAYLLRKEIQGIEVFGGIVLNHAVGGVNPTAAEAALKLGAKIVWMPTIDSEYHAITHGFSGSYDVQKGGVKSRRKPLTILEGGELSEDTREVLSLIAQHEAIMGTCHLSPEEIRKLVRGAKEAGVVKILLTHPFFKVPNVDLDFIKEMAGLGAVAEFGYCTVSPMWACATIDKVKNAIAELGASNCVIMSDGGQRHNPLPHEGMRLMGQMLYEKGLSEADLELIMAKNQMALLGL